MLNNIFKPLKITILVLVFSFNSNAQIGKYLVIFKDKANNTYSITNPLAFVNQRSIDRRTAQGIPFAEYDLPPTQSYIDGLTATGATVWYTSRWLNAALVLMTPAQATTVLTLPYVKGFENNGPMDLNGSGVPAGRIEATKDKFNIHLESINHGNATTQTNMLGLQNLHNASFKGEGKLIAVLDDGFNSIDKDTYLAFLFSENRVVETYDFVRKQAGVYDIGGHGNVVLSTIAANVQNSFVGTAPQAKFALYRTENAVGERIIEEANYLFGCERADAIGADIINSSLGYTSYDWPAYSHSNADYTGDKTLVTRAADWTARAGILVVTSAGNSGNSAINPNIGAPADGDSVMAVGAVNASEFKVGFSSEGPTFDNRIKPDVAAMGSGSTVSFFNISTMQTVLATSSGTSFSSPIMAGFAACYWQANPELNNMQVLNAIRNIGTQAAMQDNNLGWGIPKYPNLVIANDQDSRTKTIQPGIQNTFLTADNQRFILQVLPVSPNEISGSVFAKVIIDPLTQTVNAMPTVTRHFEITPAANASSAKAKVTFFVNQAEFDTYNANNSGFLDLPINNTNTISNSNLRILQYHQLPDNSFEYRLLNPIDADIKWNTTENFWEIAVEVTGFSDFYITSISETALPVRLLKFEGNSTINGNELTWQTSHESNFSHFEIERSDDAKIFTKIGEMRSNESGYYKYLENSSLITYNSSLLFYRLKMIDLDGKFEYSEIISIKNESDFGVSIVENPISNELIIKFDSKINGDAEIQIFDLSGNCIFSKQVDVQANQLKINALNWSSGEYILKFRNKFYIKNLKFLKR